MTIDTKLELNIPEAVLASAPGLLIMVWKRAPTIEGIRQLSAAYIRVFRENPTAKWGLLTAADASLSLPPVELREELARQVAIMEPHLSIVSVALEGQGFVVAAARAVVTWLYLVSKPAHPLKVHPDVSSAASWLVEQWVGAKKPANATDIASAVQRLRAL
jgi:hypothetical protein